MIYLQQKTILVAVRVLELENNQKFFLVGDSIYQQLPTQIYHQILLGANWNRALKYGQNFFVNQFSSLQKEFSLAKQIEDYQVGFYQLVFDLYYDENKMLLVPLAKNNFDQQIVNQVGFSGFLYKLIARSNKYKTDYFLQINQNLWVEQLVNVIDVVPKNINMNQFIVSQDFDHNNSKIKWKYLIKASNETKIEITKANQIIYYYDESQIKTLRNNFSYIDTQKNLVWIKGFLPTKTQKNLLVAINYENRSQVNVLKTEILEQFKNYLKNNSEKLLHLFNLTGDFDYLKKEFIIHQNQNYFQIIDILNQKFSLTKSNHFPLIYDHYELRQILFKTIQTTTELSSFEQQVNRFGVFQKDEFQAIKEKWKKLR